MRLDPAQPRVLGQVLQGYAMTCLLIGEQTMAESRLGEVLGLEGSPAASALLERSFERLRETRPAADSALLAAERRLQARLGPQQ